MSEETPKKGREPWSPEEIESFWHSLRLIRDKLAQIDRLESSEEQREALDNWFLPEGDKNLYEFLTERMKIWGGAFALADPLTKSLKLLQGVKYSDRSLPSLTIPFPMENRLCQEFGDNDFKLLPSAPKDTDELKIFGSQIRKSMPKLLECMFVKRRSDQNLATSPPEFYRWLFTGDVGVFKHPVQDELRKIFPVVGLLTAGEMTVALYVWRLALLQAARDGLDAIFLPARGFSDFSSPPNPWSQMASFDNGMPEKAWNRYIENFAGFTNQTEDYWVYQAWCVLVQKTEAAVENDAVARELTNLHLWERDAEGGWKPGPSQVALTEFLARLEDATEETDKSLAESTCRVRRAMSGGSIREFDEAFRQFSCQYWHVEAGQTCRGLLLKIHEKGQIPPVPYYYTTFVLGKQVDHLIFPVLESADSPAEVKGISQRRFEVNFCLLLLNPEWRMDGGVENASFRRQWHGHQVRELCELLARPLNDRGFYRGVAKEYAQLERKRGMAYSLAHEHLDGATVLEERLARLWEKGLQVDMKALIQATSLRVSIAKHGGTLLPASNKFFEHYSRLDLMEFYAHIAAETALSRTQRYDTDPAARSIGKDLKDRNEDGIREFLAYIGWKEDSRLFDAQDIVRQVRFGVVVIRVLWQCFYHAFLHKVSGSTARTILSLQYMAGTGMTYIEAMVRNSGSAPRDKAASRDAREISDLTRVILETESRGPAWNPNWNWAETGSLEEGCWETSFHLKIA